MTGPLNRELHDLATSVTPAPRPGDLWERGRRAKRRRQQARTGVAALAVVGAVVLGVNLRSNPVDQLPTVPVHQANESVPQQLWGQGNLTDADLTAHLRADEAPGRLSATTIAQTDTATYQVGITALTGDYVTLPVPPVPNGPYMPDYMQRIGVLSPDGRQLAYPELSSRVVTTETTTTAVVVLNLITNKSTHYPVVASDAPLVSHLTWSPNSQWLGWSSHRIDTNVGSPDCAGVWAGRILVSDGSGKGRSSSGQVSTCVPDSVSISDRGDVNLLSSAGDGGQGGAPVWTWDGKAATLRGVVPNSVDRSSSSVISPDGNTVACPTMSWGTHLTINMYTLSTKATTVITPDVAVIGNYSGFTGLFWLDEHRLMAALGTAPETTTDSRSVPDSELMGQKLVEISPERQHLIAQGTGRVGYIQLAGDLTPTGENTAVRPEPTWFTKK